MEVSGQRLSEQSGAKLCSFCEDFDITTSADGFCVECEVFTCYKCFMKHKGRKINRDHSLVKVWESDNVQTSQTDSFDLCKHHSEEFIKYYCPSHVQVCCGECIVLHHYGCKMELVRDKAVSFQKSTYLKELSSEIKECIKQAQESASFVESNRKLLTNLHEQFVRDVDSFVDNVMQHVNNMKAVILDKGKNIMVKDTKRMDDLNKEIVRLIAEVSKQNDQLESKRDQPNNLFVTSISLKAELKTCQQRLRLVKKNNTVTEYTFERDQVLENILKDKKTIGVIMEQQKTSRQSVVKQPVVAEQLQEQIPQVQQITPKQKDELDEFTDRRTSTLDVFDNKTKQTRATNNQTSGIGKTDERGNSASQLPNQQLIQRQKFCKNLNINGQILSYAGNGEVGLYVDNRPVTVGYCFEIEILSIGREGPIGLGVTSHDDSNNHLPGTESGYGYHSNGKLYASGYDHGNKGDKWKIGDKLRCTISSDDFWEYQFIFTQNGREISRSGYGGINFHFAVGMNGTHNKVKVILDS